MWSGWFPKEKLPRGRKAAGYRWSIITRLHFKRQNDRLSYPSIGHIIDHRRWWFRCPGTYRPQRDPETQQKIVILQYFFAFLNVVGGIIYAKFSQSSYLAEQHASLQTISKFYRAIDMELSIDRGNRPPMLECKKRCDNYDKLLDDAPQIPAVSIWRSTIDSRMKMYGATGLQRLSIITDDARDRDQRIEQIGRSCSLL